MNASECLAALRARFGAPEFALLEQVCNGTGGYRTRSADAIAMSLYPSRGLHLYGFEVKVSRTDWLRELKNPDKAEDIAQWCHFWYMVAPAGLIKPDELPHNWGVVEVSEKLQAAIKVKAKVLEPAKPDYPLLAAIMRRVQERAKKEDQAPIDAAYKKGSEEGAARTRASLMYETERHRQLRESVAAFEAASGVHISSWDGGKIGAAVKIVQEEQGTRNRVASSLKELRSKLQSHVDALDKSLQALAEEASA